MCFGETKSAFVFRQGYNISLNIMQLLFISGRTLKKISLDLVNVFTYLIGQNEILHRICWDGINGCLDECQAASRTEEIYFPVRKLDPHVIY